MTLQFQGGIHLCSSVTTGTTRVNIWTKNHEHNNFPVLIPGLFELLILAQNPVVSSKRSVSWGSARKTARGIKKAHDKIKKRAKKIKKRAVFRAELQLTERLEEAKNRVDSVSC